MSMNRFLYLCFRKFEIVYACLNCIATMVTNLKFYWFYLLHRFYFISFEDSHWKIQPKYQLKLFQILVFICKKLWLLVNFILNKIVFPLRYSHLFIFFLTVIVIMCTISCFLLIYYYFSLLFTIYTFFCFTFAAALLTKKL